MRKILSLLGAIFMAVGATAQTVTYDFSAIDGFSDWGSSYDKHVVEYTEATVTFAKANKQAAGNTIEDVPVTKGQEVTVVLKDDNADISDLTFVCKQWGTKAQTITLNTSRDGGETYTATSISSDDFTLTATDLADGVNAVKFTFSNSSNQIGIVSLSMTLSEVEGTIVSVEGVNIVGADGEDLGDAINLVKTESFQLKAVVTPDNATNQKVNWEVLQDEDVISLSEAGVVKALAPGKAAVVVTTEDGEFQDYVYVYVTEPQTCTVADFIANGGGLCYLTGVVSDIVMDKNDATKQNVFGNFNLTDATGTIYVYGCLTAEGEAKKFDTLGVSEGDEIVVLANEYQLYKETTNEAVNVIFVENHGAPVPTPQVTFEVEAGEHTFTVTPSVEDALYYIELLPAGYSAEFITNHLDQTLEEFGEGLEYFSGVQTQSYLDDWYIDESGDYVIVVCAVDEDYNRVGDVVITEFTLDLATGIDSISAQKAATYYNLAGQRVNGAKNGIVIKNNRKAILK